MSLFRSFALLGALLAAALPAAQAEPLKQRFAELHAAAQKEGQVVFYNAYRKETNQALVEFWRREFPDVALKIVQKQSLDLIPTIEAEKGRRQDPGRPGADQRAFHRRRLGASRLSGALQGPRFRAYRRPVQGP
ncbi:hypothetical protein ACFS3C_10650 [Azotobacter vinelandii]